MTELRITGADLARRRYGSQVTVASGDRVPCIVCGHPTGDCTTDEAATWVAANSTPDRTVLVDEDVWVDRPSPGAPNRPMTVLAAARGTRRRLSEILQLEAHGYTVRYTDEQAERLKVEPRPQVLRVSDAEAAVDEQPEDAEVEVQPEEPDQPDQPPAEPTSPAPEPEPEPAAEPTPAEPEPTPAEPEPTSESDDDDDVPAALRTRRRR